MRICKIKMVLALVLLSLFAVSCEDKYELTDISFNTMLETPTNQDSGVKNFLAMERYYYFESTDQVRLYASNDANGATIIGEGKDFNVIPDSQNPRHGDLHCNAFPYADYYFGVFPASIKHSDGPKKVSLPTTYTYRSDAHADFSFPQPGMPMISYAQNTETPQMVFHSLCGFARIQLETPETITSIVFTECGSSHGLATRPISGAFNVNNISKDKPYLSAVDPTQSGTTITVSGIRKVSGGLYTFYLPLPAVEPRDTNSANYTLNMNVANSNGKHFQREFVVKIRRNCLSYLPAIKINQWTDNGTGVSSSIGMVGCGTELRPFQIYEEADMLKVKEAFDYAASNTTDPVINGQTVTCSTYFRVVSSKVVLSNDNWTGGIKNFKGHFLYSAGNHTNVGITNNSSKPIFESISNQGIVEGIYVKRDPNTATNYSESAPFSLLCDVNNGTINECHNRGDLTSTIADVAGICVTNHGTITNCANGGVITASASNGKAAGICLTNESDGKISCYGLAVGKVNGNGGAAGVCYTNNGKIEESQVTYNRSDISCKYGGFVYENNGEVKNCEILGTLLSSTEIGGICYNNKKIIDGCRIGTSMLRGSGLVGGIVATQNNAAAEVRNCYNSGNNTDEVVADNGGVAGGLVGVIYQGKITNCYCTLETQTFGANSFGVVVGNVRGGEIANCYNGNALGNFYGGNGQPQSMKANCFNNTAQANCSEFSLSTYKVVTKATVIPSNATTNTYIYECLNAYVTANSSGNNYRAWTTSTTALPTLVPSKKGLRR